MATQVNYTQEHKGTLFPSILNIPGGAVFADQINWGDDSNFAGTKFTTTSTLLTAIDSKIQDAKNNGGLKENEVKEIVSAYYAEVALTDKQIGDKISAYINTNGIIPSLSKGTATKPTASTVTSFSYIADFNVSNHTITPVYGTINMPTMPTIPNLNKVVTNTNIDSTYYISDFSVSGHTITPVYTKLKGYTYPAAKEMWGVYE